MPSKPVDQIVCPACLAPLPSSAERCTQCGTFTRPEATAGPHPLSGEPKREASIAGDSTSSTPLLDRPWVILSLLFFVMAILGLPLLWKSRAFGIPLKVVLSAVVTLYTIGLFWGVWLIIRWAMLEVHEALA